MVIGLSPHAKLMAPPPVRAERRASGVQLSAVPEPTTFAVVGSAKGSGTSQVEEGLVPPSVSPASLALAPAAPALAPAAPALAPGPSPAEPPVPPSGTAASSLEEQLLFTIRGKDAKISH